MEKTDTIWHLQYLFKISDLPIDLFFLDCVTLEDGTDRLFQNVINLPPIYTV